MKGLGYLKKRRKDLGLSIKEVSEASGVHRDTVSTIERGLGEPGYGTVVKVAEVLGLEVSFFIIVR